MQTPGTRQERVDRALEEMGVPVIHGAISTFLAVVVLSISKSYVFRVFFKVGSSRHATHPARIPHASRSSLQGRALCAYATTRPART